MSATHLIMDVNRYVSILLDHITVIAGADTLWTAMAKHVLSVVEENSQTQVDPSRPQGGLIAILKKTSSVNGPLMLRLKATLYFSLTAQPMESMVDFPVDEIILSFSMVTPTSHLVGSAFLERLSQSLCQLELFR